MQSATPQLVLLEHRPGSWAGAVGVGARRRRPPDGTTVHRASLQHHACILEDHRHDVLDETERTAKQTS
jgi:hypothetical protein